MRRVHRTAFRPLAFASAVAGCLLLAGCGSTTPRIDPTRTVTETVTAPQTSSAAPTRSAPPSSAPAIGGASSPASPPRDPDAPSGQCADTSLGVSVQTDPDASGAGQRGAFVVLRNTGSSACTLRGYPGVSLVGDGDGAQIGAAAAERDLLRSGVRTVTVAAGSYALARVSYPAIDATGGAYGNGKQGGDPDCMAKAVDGYRIYPPHSFRARFSRASGLYGCSTSIRVISVSPVVPASAVKSFTPRP